MNLDIRGPCTFAKDDTVIWKHHKHEILCLELHKLPLSDYFKTHIINFNLKNFYVTHNTFDDVHLKFVASMWTLWNFRIL